MKNLLRSRVFAIAAAFAMGPLGFMHPEAAAAQGVHPDDVMRATLRPGWRTESGTHMAALQIDLDAGWKTYWRRPGIAGIAPRFAWSQSSNLAQVKLHWPRPEVFAQSGYRSFGYGGRLVLPFEVTPQQAGAPIDIDTDVRIGICREICIPATLRLQAELPVGGTPDAEILDALDRRPDRPGADMRDHACRVAPGGNGGLEVTASVSAAELPGIEAAILDYTDADVWVSHSSMTAEGARVAATAEFAQADGSALALDRDAVRLTLIAGDRAVELRGCPSGE